MADIFISYAHEDLDQARSLADAIEAEGWSVFWDRRIPPGTPFEDFIEQRIAESAVVVVLWSPHSITSRWVRIEAAHGRDRNPSALIPVLISESNIPFAFRDLHAADLRAWQPGNRGVEFQELLSSIDRLAPRRAVSPATDGANASIAPGARQMGMTGRSDAGTSRLRSWVSLVRRRAGALAVMSVVAVVAAVTMFLLGVPPLGVPALQKDTSSGAAERESATTATSDTEPPPQLVKIPAGSFLMGSDKAKDSSAFDFEFWPGGLQGSVTLPDYYIGKTEVTNGQYRSCVTANRCTEGTVARVARGNQPSTPVVWVTWHEAIRYCAWLEDALTRSAQTPPELKALLAGGWRITLPSEPEWEKAARGTDGRIYPWGNVMDPGRANYGSITTLPVGSLPLGASPFGIMDMSGNVREWTRSLYRPYPYVASDGREDMTASGSRVVRGGSHSDLGERTVRAGFRAEDNADSASDAVGFRVVLTRLLP